MILTNAVLSYAAHIQQELEYLEKYCQEESYLVTDSQIVKNVLKLALEHIKIVQGAPLRKQHYLLKNIQQLQSNIFYHKQDLAETLTKIMSFFEENRGNLLSSSSEDFVLLSDSIEENFVYVKVLEDRSDDEIAKPSQEAKEEKNPLLSYFPGDACSLNHYFLKCENFRGLIQQLPINAIREIVSDPILKKTSSAPNLKFHERLSYQCYIDIARFKKLIVNGKILYDKESSHQNFEMAPEKILTEMAHLLEVNSSLLAFFSPLLTQATFASACQLLSYGLNRPNEGILVKNPLKTEVEMITTSLEHIHFYFRAIFPIVCLDDPFYERFLAFERYIKVEKNEFFKEGFIEDLYSPIYKSQDEVLSCPFNQLRREIELKMDGKGQIL